MREGLRAGQRCESDLDALPEAVADPMRGSGSGMALMSYSKLRQKDCFFLVVALRCGLSSGGAMPLVVASPPLAAGVPVPRAGRSHTRAAVNCAALTHTMDPRTLCFALHLFLLTATLLQSGSQLPFREKSQLKVRGH